MELIILIIIIIKFLFMYEQTYSTEANYKVSSSTRTILQKTTEEDVPGPEYVNVSANNISS
jgi:hypothetical protein